jgi:hypothetical protein
MAEGDEALIKEFKRFFVSILSGNSKRLKV